MVRAEFSEFSYGYACIREAEQLVSSAYRLTRLPTQPSLLTEGKVGYDAALFAVDYTLFMQFKRAEFISRRHTSWCGYDGDHEERCSWMHLTEQHHRFEIDTSSNQFNAMLRYEREIAAGKWPGDAFYAAPVFHLEPALSTNYFAGQVLENSTLLQASSVTPDGKTHRVSSVRPGHVLVMSEPKWVDDAPTWGALRERVRARASAAMDETVDDMVEDVDARQPREGPANRLSALVDLFAQMAWGQQDVVEREASPMERLRAAARRLDGEVLVVGRRVDGEPGPPDSVS
jgi:hypothetical protein